MVTHCDFVFYLIFFLWPLVLDCSVLKYSRLPLSCWVQRASKVDLKQQ